MDKIHSSTEIKKRKIFNQLIERRWGISINPPKPSSENSDDNEFEEHKDEDETKRVILDIEYTVDIHGKLLNQKPAKYSTQKCLSSWERICLLGK